MTESRETGLRPLGGFDVVSHGRFEARHAGHLWTVDLDFFDFGEKIHLYRDGEHAETRKSPAKFRLDDSAEIDAKMGLIGMERVDLVTGGSRTTMAPVEGTAEGWRLGLARDRPELSRLIGAASWTILVIALIYEVPQLIALAAGALGSDFEAPLMLPGPANFAFGLLALAAAVERALRFKTSRWL